MRTLMAVENKRTAFQSWALEMMERKSMNPGDVHRELIGRGLSLTESYTYRILQGKAGPERPGYDLVLGIGEVLGDAKSALELAGYKLPKIMDRVIDPDLQRWVEIYAGRDQQARARLLSVVEQISTMEKMGN
jgi:hypothetical protein